MILLSLVGVFFFGGLLAWLSEFVDVRLPRWVAMLSAVICAGLISRLVFMVESGGVGGEWKPSMSMSTCFAVIGYSVRIETPATDSYSVRRWSAARKLLIVSMLVTNSESENMTELNVDSSCFRSPSFGLSSALEKR